MGSGAAFNNHVENGNSLSLINCTKIASKVTLENKSPLSQTVRTFSKTFARWVYSDTPSLDSCCRNCLDPSYVDMF